MTTEREKFARTRGHRELIKEFLSSCDDVSVLLCNTLGYMLTDEDVDKLLDTFFNIDREKMAQEDAAIEERNRADAERKEQISAAVGTRHHTADPDAKFPEGYTGLRPGAPGRKAPA